MSDNSKIEWTQHTFNPWWGCARISPGCVRCYADSLAQRYGQQVWRRHGPRRMLSEANWAKPLRWNRDAERAGIPAMVFCASMADVFEDHPDVVEARKRLWGLIEVTPWLRWQLLTKRPENVTGMVPWGNDWPSWVWLGTSIENQRYAWTSDNLDDEDRFSRLRWLDSIPAKVKFISAEPLLGPVDLGIGDPHATHASDYMGGYEWICLDCSAEEGEEDIRWFRREDPQPHGISWVIIGGESGPKARPMSLRWARMLVAECQSAGVPVFVKQLGAVLGRELGAGPKGGDWDRWPKDLQIRQFPRAAEEVAA